MCYSDRCPRHILIQRQGTGARELQAGNQRTGHRYATAQRASGLCAAINLREERRQRTAVRPHAEKLAHASDRVADLPEWGRPGAIGSRLLRHP